MSEISHLKKSVFIRVTNGEDELFEVYKTFCSSGSTKLEKVEGRLAIMVKSFCLYHELDIPEEWKDMMSEVEEKLAMKEEGTIETALAEEFISNTEENSNDISETVFDIESVAETEESVSDVENSSDTKEIEQSEEQA